MTLIAKQLPLSGGNIAVGHASLATHNHVVTSHINSSVLAQNTSHQKRLDTQAARETQRETGRWRDSIMYEQEEDRYVGRRKAREQAEG